MSQLFTKAMAVTLTIGIAACATAGKPRPVRGPSSAVSEDTLTFHLDSERQGWKPNERILKPVRDPQSGHLSLGPSFGQRWSTPAFESVTAQYRSPKDGTFQLFMDPANPQQPFRFAPHLYATPLYVNQLTLSDASHAGKSYSVVFAATTNGVVYAVNAGSQDDPSLPLGSILWKTRVDIKPGPGVRGQKGDLGTPAIIWKLDGDQDPQNDLKHRVPGLPLGILGTPIIDLSLQPPRMYVASVDQNAGWQVFALNLTNGKVLGSVPLTDATLSASRVAGQAKFQGQFAMSQRGALALSKNGTQLYVPFGAYNDGGVGFMVMIDTRALVDPAATVRGKILSAFAADLGNPVDENGQPFASGGMWSAGGPVTDADGTLYATTGNSGVTSGPQDGTWGQSLVRWDTTGSTLRLSGTYTPFNYCQMDIGDIDLAGSSPMVVDLDPAQTKTPHLIAFGGKQGNVYLIDRDHLPGRLDHRPPCAPNVGTTAQFVAKFEQQASNSSADHSLLHPDPLRSGDGSLFDPKGTQYAGQPGPLNVFGPYQERFNNGLFAKMRTTPALFQDDQGNSFLFVSGTTRAASATEQSVVPPPVAPSLVKLKIVTGQADFAFLKVDTTASEPRSGMLSPGSPVVTSHGSSDGIVWVIDANIPRVHSLVERQGAVIPRPILYAFDAQTLAPLWNSEAAAADQLHVGGKYSAPTIGGGTVFVGTDRIQAYGIKN